MQHPRHYISIIITFFNTWLFASNFVVKFKIYETRTRVGDTILYYYLNQRQLGTWNKWYVWVLKIDNSYYFFLKIIKVKKVRFYSTFIFTGGYTSRALKGPWRRGEESWPSYFFLGWGLSFYGDFSWGISHKRVTNLPMTYEKLHWKGESYRLSN